MAEPNLIKVCLTNRGEDTETPWAADLGPAGADGSRKVKLVNVPFMHAKPTWGDTIIVRPVRNDGPPTWDREGVPWKQIATKIVEDGGRWAMIIDYLPTTSPDEAFAALGEACDKATIVCEGAWGPRDRDPGRVYLAVQKELTAEQVMGILTSASLPMELTQIHPEPKKKQRAQTVVGISDDAGRPPAKRTTTESPASETAKKSESSQASKPAKAAKSESSQASKPAEEPPARPIANAAPAARTGASAKGDKTATSASATSAPAKSAPTASASTKSAPAKSAPTASASTKSAPAKSAPTASASTKSAPSKSAPSKSAPSKAAAAKSAPAKAAPAKAATAKAPAKAAPAKPPAKAAPAKAPAKAAPAKPAKKK